MNKLVIYTAVTGHYDDLSDVSPEDNVDYICFTDSQFQGRIPLPWKQIVLPESKLNNKNLARYCKLNPHKLLPQYNKSLWIDGNIAIINNVRDYAEQILSICDVASYDHWWRDKTEQELFECARNGFDPAWKLHKQLLRYKKEKYVSENFYENNVIFRNHMKENVIAMHDFWWSEYLLGGKRDQYSYTYSAFKNSINIKSLGTHDPRIVKQYFNYKGHKGKRPISQYFWIVVNRIYISVMKWKVNKPSRDNLLLIQNNKDQHVK